MANATTPSAILDVREIPPRVRHPKIFETFDALAPGDGFVLVNDHDPRPLLYQFQFERANTFGWRYLEQGPEVWRVEITRRASRLTESATVSDVSRTPEGLRVLQQHGVNHCCGSHLTLREAAAAAGVPVATLLSELDEATGGAPSEPLVPGTRLPAEVARRTRVDLDVREDIRRGEEPFGRIMAAVKALPPDGVLVLRAPFEPIPLYAVLGKRGFAHVTECRTPTDWTVWFYRDVEPTAASPHRPAPAPSDPAVVDVRGLEPPQPLCLVLERLEALAPGERLEVLHERRPMFLYPLLDERGLTHETDEPEPGLVRIVIRRPAR